MSTFGQKYRVTTFGESHSKGVGCVIDGFPSNFKIDQDSLQYQLNRRRPGQTKLTTQRDEKDKAIIISGLNTQNLTLGSPIMIMVYNEDMRPQDYKQFDQIPRPGHADFTYQMKYEIRAESGGGRSSARETIGRVCAGAIAQQFLCQMNISISAWVSSVGNIEIPKEVQQQLILNPPTQEQIEEVNTQYQFRNPHQESALEMVKLIEQVKHDKDSIGGTVTCVIKGCPVGLGEPCFDKFQAVLAHAIMSIPATKGFEFGSGFEGTKLRGSVHNDRFKNLKPITNNAGGTLGGITNGENIYFKVAFKPVSTIGLEQETSNFKGEDIILEAHGRHDPCVVSRAVPVIESMAAIVVLDLYLLIMEQLEAAIKSNDTVTKLLPALKIITNSLPFPDRHTYIKDPRLVKLLLIVYPLLPETIDMILGQLLNVFKDQVEWIKGCCKAIEEYAVFKSNTISSSKFYSLEYFQQVLHCAAEACLELDDICYGFIIFLKHAESEKMVLHIMNKIEAVKEEYGYGIRSLSQFCELVESTVLQLYQEESNKNTEDQHFRSVAIGLQESQNRRVLHHQNTLSSPSMRSPAVSRQRSESFGSLNDEIIDNLNIEEILIQEKPRILDSDQAEYFKSNERLQNLIYFITDPYFSQPSLIFDTDLLAEHSIEFDENDYKKFKNIKIDKLFTIRSFKTLLFLTDIHNHKLLTEANNHLTQIIFRSISGFLQNNQSIGNITHIVALIQFYLKNDTKDTIYYFLYCNLHFQFLDYIYNSYVVDILIRFIDPTYIRIPAQLKDEIWYFLNSQGFISYIIGRIINKDYLGVNRKEFHISKEGYNILKRIYDQKVINDENTSEQHTYNLSSNLDQFLGPLMPGKTIQQNLIKKKRVLHAAQTQIYSRRHSGTTMTGKFNKIILVENIHLSELNGNQQDIDRLKDVIQYYHNNQLDNEDAITPNQGTTQLGSEKNIPKQTHRSVQSDQFFKSDFLINQIDYKPVDIKSFLGENKSVDTKLPSLKSSTKISGGSVHTSRIVRQSSKQGQEFIFKKKKSLKIENIEEISNNFKKLNNPISSPTSASRCHKFYPNSDISVVDHIMREEYQEYIQYNNEFASYQNSQLLNFIVNTFQSQKYKFQAQNDCFTQIIDEKLLNFEKLIKHYTLKILEPENGSAYELGFLIINILKKLSNCNSLQEQCNKIYRNQIPRLCRNISLLNKQQQFPQQLNLQQFSVNVIGTQKIVMYEILQLMICNVKIKYSNIFIKLNDTAMHILTIQFHTSFHNGVYQRIFMTLVRHLFVYASEKQLLSLVFKVNLIESIHAAYKNTVINRVVIKEWNTEQYILYLQQLSSLIINAFDLREDLKQLRQSLIRLQSYQKLKELSSISQFKFDVNQYTKELIIAEQQLVKIKL
ncbi:unnamed protein product [Paramecium pentaurelia]|uniref:Chorismate synthase n=1 Tax=Paramecium pentaurelia TaxID=43138 RepID=A0A8S1U174_9CILI|nr:unnamed protein product [Paramecium pentaurelia]